MKKVIFVCDLCGWQMGEPYVTLQLDDDELSERHICVMCAKKIREALPKPKATKAEEPKEEKPKRKRIDQGKVLALAKAGWTVAKIADEMGCSVQTVRNIIKAAEEEKEAEE